jgi:hypothetical protein
MIADLPGGDGGIDVAVELTGTMSFAYDVNDIGLATGGGETPWRIRPASSKRTLPPVRLPR